MKLPRITARDALRLVAGLTLLVLLSFLGDWLVRVTHAPVPGSVIGMLILTVMIEARLIQTEWLRPAAELLVRHLALLYVPAGVAVMAYVAVVRHDLLAITVAALASLIAVLVVVGTLVQRFERAPADS